MTSTIVPGYGDLADAEVMLYYKIDLAIAYRDALYERKNKAECPLQEKLDIATRVLDVVAHLNLLRAQLTALQDSHIALIPPSPADITTAEQATTAVDNLVRTDAILASALGLLTQVLDATTELQRA